MSPASPANIAALAATDFQPMTRRPGDWMPPTNDAWPLLADPHLVTLRLAFELLHKTKPDVVATTWQNPRLAKDVQERLRITQAMFAQWADVTGTAEARMICALAVVEVTAPGADT